MLGKYICGLQWDQRLLKSTLLVSSYKNEWDNNWNYGGVAVIDDDRYELI